MRKHLFLLVTAGFVGSAGFLGCGDGEEGGGGGGTSGSGGGGTGGVGGAPGCSTASFTYPTSGAKLTAVDDSDGDCSNGIDVDVVVATNAPEGTSAKLLADGQEVGTAVATAAVLKFAGVTLQSTGSTKLAVRIGNDPDCETSVEISQACGATCEISKPTLSSTHPKLNGVPVAEGGDRASASGQDYQVAFEVNTSIEDGQPVTLTVDGKAQAAVALAAGGVAKFPGVTLTPDGDHKVQAGCTPKGGQPGSSAEVTFPVDTTSPDLSNLVPADATFLGPSTDSNSSKAGLQFKVCGQTTAADALDLPGTLGGKEKNFCVGIGTSTPVCTEAKKGAVGGADGGCVELDCPGGAPFDMAVTVSDDAGNPTAKTIKGVTCASSLPSVQVIEPLDGSGADVSKHILAASMAQPRKDQNAGKAGAQYTVVACTDTNGKGTLLAGLAGGTATPVAGQVDIAAQPAQASDNCPAGYPHVLKFTDADLPESTETATNALAAATELRVEVKATSTAKGTSPAVQVWVDSVAPTIAEFFPNPTCGKLYQSATDVLQNFSLTSSNSPVSLTITSGGTPQNYSEVSYVGQISAFGSVLFKTGTNDITATTTEPSGNAGALKSPCAVTVGNPPVVTWTAPTQSTMLNATTDGTPGTAGWQGALTVQTDVGGSGGTVTFKFSCGAATTTIGTANINGAGVATLVAATLPECAGATITAETSNITGKGVGTASLSNKPVDTVVPDALSALSPTVKDRRATTFQLSWTAPADGGSTVGGYQVRVSKQAITAANFDAAEVVSFLGAPKAPGQTETLDVNNRMIETNYYFAVAATDAAGNRSSIVAAGPAKATFNQIVLNGGTNEEFGIAIDGSTSVNGDAFADLLVGGRNSAKAYLWFGSASGYGASPDVTFTGASNIRFGQGACVVGDIDGDGLKDIALSAPFDASKGRVYIFKGRVTWPSALATAQADYVIEPDTGADPKFGTSFFGTNVTRLGDIDEDGADDFAIGAFLYGGGTGYVAVVRGVPSGQTFPATVSVPQAVGTRVIAFVGDAALPSGFFGLNVVGFGPYYSGGHRAMVISAPYAGRVYSFQGAAGLTGTVQATAAKEAYVGSTPLRTGFSLGNLGPLGAVPSLGVGSPGSPTTANGDVRIFSGSASTLFGGAMATIQNSAAASVGDMFGTSVFGGGFSGSPLSVSLVGGSGVDVGFSSALQAGAAAKLYLADGSKLSGGGDIVTLADVVLSLPADWVGTSFGSGPIKDMNNDGYADIALGEQKIASGTYNGRVLVLW